MPYDVKHISTGKIAKHDNMVFLKCIRSDFFPYFDSDLVRYKIV
uniref:Uncharacterized protein n=1 Tax=Nelumbo nucifera TaxID=4432 RepID=A0A822YG80_NELNU|nr:TPA_asm: hypothetical protein HUJ06_009342 [Nelumbo nucifera]